MYNGSTSGFLSLAMVWKWQPFSRSCALSSDRSLCSTVHCAADRSGSMGQVYDMHFLPIFSTYEGSPEQQAHHNGGASVSIKRLKCTASLHPGNDSVRRDCASVLWVRKMRQKLRFFPLRAWFSSQFVQLIYAPQEHMADLLPKQLGEICNVS